jgi:predicted Asp-tRNA(Asn)/Glu-tRNA(Gln) amidotransferase subunit C
MVVDKIKVEKEAKEILDKFAKALEKVEKSRDGDSLSYVERKEFERVEGDGEDCPKEFKNRMLENAPNHDDDFVIAETGGWRN